MRSELVPVVVTGIGAFSSIGRNIQETIASLKSCRSGIGVISLFDTSGLKIHHAAEIKGYNPLDYFSAEDAVELDRTSQFAQIAAKQAVSDSGIDLSSYSADRIAILSGICSGTFEVPGDELSDEREQIRRRLKRVRHFQTLMLAKKLGIHGLQASISTACASSGTALAYAFELLQSDRADAILVGGSDGLLHVTYAGFHALGAMAEQPCSPFSTNVGVSFGEGAGFVVLEPLAKAVERGARIYGEVAGYGCTGDAYHYTSPHPSGDGLRRAMEAALKRADATVDDIGYINAHGTGTRDNDGAESLAIRDLCEGKRVPPPVSSTKSFTGHTLGAAGILEFIISLLGSKEGFLPPTVNFEAPRPGCDLDYIPNQARPADYSFFLSNSAAFGGVNTVVAGRREPAATSRSRRPSRLVITGLGMVSPVGSGMSQFREALRQGPRGPHPLVDRFDVSGYRNQRAALVRGFKPRQLTPMLDVRRLDLLSQYATVSAGLAYGDACLSKQPPQPEKIGCVVALAAGPVGSEEAFNKSVEENGVAGASAKHFPSIVVSTVGGQICQMLQLKGLNSTLSDGLGAGLHGTIHACEMLRGSQCEEQVISVAPDEISHWLFRHVEGSEILDDEARPYDPASHGIVLGEGSFALTVERLESAEGRGARIYAEILGYGVRCDAASPFSTELNGEWMRQAMYAALKDANTQAGEIDFAVGLGHGRPVYDAAEKAAFHSVLGEDVAISLPSSLLGMGLASSGAAELTLAALGLHDQTVYLPVEAKNAPERLRKCLVFGGSEAGNYAAFVLGVPDGAA